MEKVNANKRKRQYVGILAAILAYYIVHEGTHFIVAILYGTFRKVNFIGLGVQIDVYADTMSDTEMGIFCISGAIATLLVAWILILLRKNICKIHTQIVKSAAYYVTIAMMFIDPLYLGVLCNLFGGGDMNGISLIIPELLARGIFLIVMLIHVLVFIKLVLPAYKKAFEKYADS